MTDRLSKCPACGDDRSRRHGVRDTLVLVKCLGCGLVYSDPQPRESVHRRYLEQYDLAAYFVPMAPRKRVLFERRLKRLPKPWLGRDRLCDVGCADGQFLELARSYGWRPYGIEMNPPAADRAKARGATIFEGMFEESEDLPWGSFNLVTCWDCLEHTPEPRLFAERLTRLLAPDGILALTTLNRRSLARAVFKMNWSMVCEDHFTYWDYDSLTRLFKTQGLIVIDRENFGLGRDFVKVIDRLRRTRRDAAPLPVSSKAEAGGWDIQPMVLMAENVLNRVFQITGGGVGIGLTLRRAEASVALR